MAEEKETRYVLNGWRKNGDTCVIGLFATSEEAWEVCRFLNYVARYVPGGGVWDKEETKGHFHVTKLESAGAYAPGGPYELGEKFLNYGRSGD